MSAPKSPRINDRELEKGQKEMTNSFLGLYEVRQPSLGPRKGVHCPLQGLQGALVILLFEARREAVQMYLLIMCLGQELTTGRLKDQTCAELLILKSWMPFQLTEVIRMENILAFDCLFNSRTLLKLPLPVVSQKGNARKGTLPFPTLDFGSMAGIHLVPVLLSADGDPSGSATQRTCQGAPESQGTTESTRLV